MLQNEKKKLQIRKLHQFTAVYTVSPLVKFLKRSILFSTKEGIDRVHLKASYATYCQVQSYVRVGLSFMHVACQQALLRVLAYLVVAFHFIAITWGRLNAF